MNPAQLPTISDRAVVSYILQGLEGAATNFWANNVANRFDSNMATERYAGLGNVPMMREWIGSKNEKQLREYSLTISNKDWESTLRVFRRDLQRDKTGQLMAKIGDLAQRNIEHEAKLVSQLIDSGNASTYGTAYDGVNFFATTHVVGDSGTLSNLITYDAAVVATPTTVEFATAILNMVTQLFGFKDDTGEPTNQNANDFLLMVPTNYWSIAAQALTKDRLANNTDNPLLNLGLQFQLVQNPRLTATDVIYLFVKNTSWRPFIIQTENGPSVEVLGEGSDYAFFNAAHLYSVIKSGNVGYGRFDKAVRLQIV